MKHKKKSIINTLLDSAFPLAAHVCARCGEEMPSDEMHMERKVFDAAMICNNARACSRRRRHNA